MKQLTLSRAFFALFLLAFGFGQASMVQMPPDLDRYFRREPPYAPKVVFCTKAPVAKDSSKAIEVDVVTSDSTIPWVVPITVSSSLRHCGRNLRNFPRMRKCVSDSIRMCSSNGWWT